MSHVCGMYCLSMVMADAASWRGYWILIIYCQSLISDVCYAYKLVALAWPLSHFHTWVHAVTPAQFGNHVRLIVIVLLTMDRCARRMVMFTIPRAKWNWWLAVRVWCVRIVNIVKVLGCAGNHAGVWRVLRVVQMVAFMLALVKCVHQIAVSMCSKFRCRTACCRSNAQERQATKCWIVQQIARRPPNKWCAVVMAISIVRYVKWKCWVAGKLIPFGADFRNLRCC